MANSNVLNAELREDVGKGASRRLRRQGKIPAVIYGGKKDPATLTLDHDTTLHASSTEAFYSSVLEIKVEDGRTQKVVVRDVQILYHLIFLAITMIRTRLRHADR